LLILANQCDLRKPTCLRCEKANISCSGYERKLVFVNRTPDQPSTTALSTLAELRQQSQDRVSRVPHYDHVLISLSEQLQAPKTSTIRFRKDAFHLLEQLYLPQPQIKSSEWNPSWSSTSWVSALCDLEGPSKALNTSLLAFCIIQVLVTGSGTASLEQALNAYDEALKELQNELRNELSNPDETLAAIVLLSTCEVCLLSKYWIQPS
jgi:Fungal Zn(2)-Cys(6) binuclear cluster domain